MISEKKDKKTLVIIPNYNKVDLLKDCLLHLLNQNTKDFDVLIVDNGSDEDTVNTINEMSNNDERIHKILLSDNFGFATAVNKGFKYSIDNNYTYSILLNNDAFVDNNFVRALVNKISRHKRCFAVSSLMISYYNKNLVDDFGDKYTLLGFAYQSKTAHRVSSIVEDEKVFSACGGASIYSNLILQKIGFMDDNFFAYLEDVDLSYRAKLNGYFITTCKDAICHHIGSATSGSKYNDFKVKLSARNSIYLIYKNMPNWQILLNIVPIFFGIMIKFAYFLLKGFGSAYIIGLASSVKNIKHVNRVDFKQVPVISFILIEIELIINTFEYFYQMSKRVREF